MTQADLVFRNVSIVDGSGADAILGDVAILGERIVAVGGEIIGAGQEIDGREIDARVIDGTGKTLAPGFIDVHTHDDRYLLTNPDMAPKVSQGVTTVVTGNCGMSLAPFPARARDHFPFNLWLDREDLHFSAMAGYLKQLEDTPPAANAAVLVGHSTLRALTMDSFDRPATASEIEHMREILAACMADGAIGMSSGLYYPAAQAAPTDEVAQVAAAMAPYDGIYTAHIRDEGKDLLKSIREAAEIARRAGVQLCLSHHKSSGLEYFGGTEQSLPLIEELAQNQRLTLDVYPYHASSTMMNPAWVTKAAKVMVTWSKGKPDASGRDLDELAAELGLDRVAAAEAVSPAGAIYFQMDEKDVQRVLKFPAAMIGSDGIPDDSHPHPRLWGTFPRVLGHYARDLGLFSLEEAVHRMSGLPAEQFGLKDRGEIRVGAFADLVLFDAKTVVDSATFDAPKQPAAGIDEVFVAGQSVWANGAPTGARPGRPIRLVDTNRGGASRTG